MNDTIVLDTNAILSLFAGNRRIADMLGEDKAVIVPAIVCGEFEAGIQGRTRREMASRQAFNGFLSLNHVSVLPVTRRTSRIYGKLYAALAKAGTPIPTSDIWIAASTFECDGILLTSDGHFRHVPQLPTITF